jgi:pimeloyl-ACP methyl ester carboxylesterase
METFVLIPGAGGDAGYWSRLVPELESRGHAAIAVDIREDDAALGLPEYADITLAAIGGCTDTVLVAQSMGAFTAAMVAARVPVRAIVMLNAMIPCPGETPGQWWDAVGWEQARHDVAVAGGYPTQFDTGTYFLHDVPPEVLASLPVDQRGPSDTPFGQPCTFESWQNVPLFALAGADDRFFPVDLQRRLAVQRLGVEVDILTGGHLLALGHAAELADRLTAYASALPRALR